MAKKKIEEEDGVEGAPKKKKSKLLLIIISPFLALFSARYIAMVYESGGADTTDTV